MRGRGGVFRCLLVAWLLAVELAGLPVAAATEWEAVANLPSPGRRYLAAVSDSDGRIYAIGGYASSNLDTVQRYDPETNSWGTIASLNVARRSPVAARGGDERIYVIGGYSSTELDSVEVYDPSENTWTLLTATMSTARANAAVATGKDGRIYVFGGRNAGTPLATAEVFDPVDRTWESIEPMPRARWGAAAATAADGRIYVIGGADASNKPIAFVDIYDPATGEWEPEGPSLPSGRREMGAVTGADGRIYVIGGYDVNATNSVLSLDPRDGIWEAGAPLKQARYAMGVTITPAGVIYAVGGYNTSTVSSTERFVTIAVDDLAPPVTTVDLDGPDGTNGWFTGPVTVTLSARDEQSEVQGIHYRIDGGEWQDYVAPVVIEDDGVHALEFFATDTAGNAEEAHSLSLRIDATPPRIGGAPDRLPDADGWYREPVEIHFTCDDDTSGVDEGACPAPVTLSQEGRDQSAKGSVVDRAGNRAEVTVDGINIDRTPPSIAASLHGPDGEPVEPNAAGWFSQPVTVVFTCADALSGAHECPDPEVLADGAGQRVEGVATDVAGNTARTVVEGINVDTVPPTVTVAYQDSDGRPVAATNGWYPGPLRIVFTCSDDGSGVRVCPADRTLGAGAGQSVHDVVEDHAGNQTPVEISGINVAGPAPSITYALVDAAGEPIPESPSGWYDRPVTVTFTCSGGTGVLVTCGPDVTLGEGAGQIVTGEAVDEAGKRAEVTVGPINVDLTPPSIDCTVPDQGWSGDNRTVVCTARDDGAGLADPEDASFTLRTDVPAGEERAAAPTESHQVCDRVGHCTQAGPYTFGVDRKAPEIAATVSVGGVPYTPGRWVNQPVTVTFTCVDEGAGLAPGSPPAPVTLVDDGAGQAVTGTCVDRVGNTASRVVDEINIDRTAPVTTAAVAGPLGDAGWYRGTVTVTLTATDGGSGTADIRYQIDGGTPERYQEPLAIDTEGTTRLTVWSSDVAGNVEAARMIEVRIDPSPPVVSCEEPDSWHEGATVACTAVDPVSGLRDPGDAHFTLTPIPHGLQVASIAGDGTRTVCDVAGNCTVAGPVSLPVDTAAPEIHIVHPAGTYLLNQEVAAEYACSDGGSGVVTCDGPVPSGALIDTSRVGNHAFQVDARDVAGNTASKTVTYQVRYGVEQIGPLGLGPWVWVRLRLVDAEGVNHSAAAHRLRAAGLTTEDGAAHPWPLARIVYVGLSPQGGEYLAMVSTWGLPSGTHTLWFTVDDDPAPYSVALRTGRLGWIWPWGRW
ncbi:kelch repeat-containing protein [Sphaerobacter sp.]|uniref:OmpL47-type beta-barrel domain-containing protein n=1 Tax=Sphaerobacter sp. TaxID=2099654 RepID=UPI001DD055D4|nr:kelch repeat-containing protein [Sphaerobacter sp.]MBX5446187.1 hypothetical protein [Sphaerobacter sp.]